MNSELQLLYLANCGLRIRAPGLCIMVDALMTGGGSFGQLTPEDRRQLMDGEEPFGRADLLLFTHGHFDHFSPEDTMEYLRLHPQTRVMLPSEQAGTLSGIESSRIIEMSGAAGAVQLSFPGGPRVDYVRTGHISFAYPGHYCVMISTERTSLLFTADMDFHELQPLANHFSLRGGNDAPDVWNGRDLLVFFNPILLGRKDWAQEAASWHAAHTYIYHVPPEHLDQYLYRKMALRRFPRYRDLFRSLSLLLEPMTNLK